MKIDSFLIKCDREKEIQNNAMPNKTKFIRSNHIYSEKYINSNIF